MNKIILVTGGARSGKSTFAEKLATDLTNGRKAYVATAQVLDDEMAQRIRTHQSRRGTDWQTFEAPINADIAISKAGKEFEVILFDCLTIYISNFLCAFESLDDIDKINFELQIVVNKLINEAKKISGTIIFVTNEVGDGIVPENKLARVYRDCAGITNQMIAAVSDEVYLIVTGIPVKIKSC